MENKGEKIYKLMKLLFPIMRSITGEGNRKTLKILNEIVPLEITEVPTGTGVFDWKVPREWNCMDAYVKNSAGVKIIDLKNSNLHVVNYSAPIHKKISLKELKNHLYTLSNQPTEVPYVTSYYKERWGFCLSQKDFENLEDGEYEVFIDSELKEGNLTFGEFFVKGKSEKEILFSSYICHPSQCNDSLSGVALATYLADAVSKMDLKFSYRFLFIPETIGAIAWLKLNEKNVGNIFGGYVLTCVGDSGSFTYKKSRSANHVVDIVAEKILKKSGEEFKLREFDPADGSDERQFSSPGFNIPMGSLMKTKYGEFKEYHTSGDNLEFVNSKSLGDSFLKYLEIIDSLEKNFGKTNESQNDELGNISEDIYITLNPKCEPQLGKRGLYNTTGGRKNVELNEAAIFWTLNFCDGKHTLQEISQRSKIPKAQIIDAAKILEESGLLKKL